MSEMASQITSVSIVCSTIYSGADQGNRQSSASLAFVPGIHRWPVNSPNKRPVTRKCFHLMTSSWYLHSGFWLSPDPAAAVPVASADLVLRSEQVVDEITGPTHAKLVSLTSPCCSRWPCPMNTLKANNGPLDPGVGDERFFRFKRNAWNF